MAFSITWNLSRYFYTGLDDPKLESDIARMLPDVKAFAEKYRSIFPSFREATQILEFYREYTELSHQIGLPSYYLFYRSSLDSQDLDVLKKMGELDQLGLIVSNELLFIAQGWKAIGHEQIMKWSEDPILQAYKNDLVSTATGIKYILSEKEEYVLNLKSLPLGLASSLEDELRGAYEFPMVLDGEEKILTEEEVRTYRQHSDRSIRKSANDSLRGVYGQKHSQITLGNIYTSIVKNWSSEMKLRGYGDHVMRQRNISEDLDDAVVDLLLSEVESAYPLYARFLRAKAKYMGLEGDFHTWDTGAPIGSSDRDFTFEEAFDLHLSVMKDFDPDDFYAYSLQMCEEERIDVFPRSGKRGGAFSSSAKDMPGFVLLNFTGKLRDVSTISHELGHAIHGHLSQCQEAPVYDPPLSLAETASIFSEMLLFEKVKTQITSEEYLDLLNERISDVFATIFRQVQYVLFEKRVHETIHNGGELTYRDLNVLWREEQEKMSQGSVLYDVPADQESGWSMIPHIFHTPFYCYAYAFGNLLTFALYNKVQDGSLRVEDYKDILRSGGSVPPKPLLERYGIDIASSEFYRAGIREVEKLVEEFEALV